MCDMYYTPGLWFCMGPTILCGNVVRFVAANGLAQWKTEFISLKSFHRKSVENSFSSKFIWGGLIRTDCIAVLICRKVWGTFLIRIWRRAKGYFRRTQFVRETLGEIVPQSQSLRADWICAFMWQLWIKRCQLYCDVFILLGFDFLGCSKPYISCWGSHLISKFWYSSVSLHWSCI